MAKSILKDRKEPAPDPNDTAEPTCFVQYRIGELWRSYVDESGEQLFPRRRAVQLADYLRDSNPGGWKKVEVAAICK